MVDQLVSFAQIITGAAITYVAAKATWDRFSPLILPGLKLARNQLLRDVLEAEKKANESIVAKLSDHELNVHQRRGL